MPLVVSHTRKAFKRGCDETVRPLMYPKAKQRAKHPLHPKLCPLSDRGTLSARRSAASLAGFLRPLQPVSSHCHSVPARAVAPRLCGQGLPNTPSNSRLGSRMRPRATILSTSDNPSTRSGLGNRFRACMFRTMQEI